MTERDVRRGLSSASIMHRLKECSGSLALTNELKASGKYIEIPSPYAQSGTRIHQWLVFDGQPCPTPQIRELDESLTTAELRTAQKCAELKVELLNAWAGSGENEYEFLFEQRLWYRQGLWPRFSGQPDFVAIDRTNKRALILDFKTGRKESDEASDNLQLRSYIVLLKYNEPHLQEIQAAIVEPLVSWDSVRVKYAGDALGVAEQEIVGIVDRAEREPTKRIAGTWCGLCPARLNCPEAQGYIESIPKPTEGKLMIELPKGEAGTALWRKIQVAEKLLKDMEAAYHQMLENEPDCLPGLILPDRGKERRIVAHPDRLKAVLAEYLTGPEIDGCSTYHPGKIEELLGLKLKLSGRELEKLFERLTKNVIETIHDRPFVRERTKKERELAGKLVDARGAFTE